MVMKHTAKLMKMTEDPRPLDSSFVSCVLTKDGKPSQGKRGLKVHECPCGKIFTRAEHLRRHQASHSQEIQLVCPFPACGRPFYRQDLLQKHQERHLGPKTRLDWNQKIPGYTFAPIRISKEGGVKARPPLAKVPTDRPSAEKSGVPRLDKLATSAVPSERDSLECASPAQRVISSDDDSPAVIPDLDFIQGTENGESEQLVFLGVEGCKAHRQVAEVQRAVGWNVDPFFNMPKFRDRRIQTEKVYHHSLKALGRVGKSPRWVEKIVQSHIGFLSSLCLAVSHLDVVRGTKDESAVTLAAKSEVMALIRARVMDKKARMSDITLMAIAQLLSSEMIFSSAEVLSMHITGLEAIIRMRGGLHNIGWNDEISVVIGAKIMLVSIFHEIPCPNMFSNLCYKHLTPHFPALSPRTPCSPTYAISEGLDDLKEVENCSPATLTLLQDMKDLTDAFFARHKIERGSPGAMAGGKIAFKTRVEEIQDRLFTTTSLAPKDDPYHDIVLFASQIYVTALKDDITFSTACQRLSTPGQASIPQLMSLDMNNTDLLTSWDGGMTGVLLWSCAVGAAAASGLRDETNQANIDRAGRWLRFTAMNCMILTTTAHAAAFMECVKGLLDIQTILRGEGGVVEDIRGG